MQANLRLVAAIARRYRPTGVGLSDLLDAGQAGLREAVDDYPRTSDVPFTAYAAWRIRRALARAVAEAGSKPPDLIDAWDLVVSQTGRQPTIAELAAATGLSEDEVRAALEPPP